MPEAGTETQLFRQLQNSWTSASAGVTISREDIKIENPRRFAFGGNSAEPAVVFAATERFERVSISGKDKIRKNHAVNDDCGQRGIEYQGRRSQSALDARKGSRQARHGARRYQYPHPAAASAAAQHGGIDQVAHVMVFAL